MQFFETMQSEGEWAAEAGSGCFDPRIALLGRLFSKSNKGGQEKNDGIRGRDWSAEELEREIGEERATVGRTQETRESKSEMGGLW